MPPPTRYGTPRIPGITVLVDQIKRRLFDPVVQGSKAKP
jgi:hypothetical protein